MPILRALKRSDSRITLEKDYLEMWFYFNLEKIRLPT